MQDAFYLATNGMYSVEQTKIIVADGRLGVNKVLEYPSYQEKMASELVEKFQSNCTAYTGELLIVFAEQLDTSNLATYKQDVFDRFLKMKLEQGLMDKLI